MKIWLGSWNVELQFPDNRMINKWVLQSDGRQTAHTIAIGLQEAERTGSIHLAGYHLVTQLIVDGRTKGTANSQHLAIFTAHLDSKSTQTRQGQITKLLNLIQSVDYDVAFFMGDLNYRVKSVANTSVDDMVDLIANHRDTLYAQDTFDASDFGGSWTFPDPCDGAPNQPLYLPTYILSTSVLERAVPDI